MALSISRRNFLKATAVASGSALLLGSAQTAFADSRMLRRRLQPPMTSRSSRAHAVSAMDAARCSAPWRTGV